MVIDSSKAIKNLKKKGFSEAPGDHKFLEYHYEGRFILRTKVSHGAAHDLEDYLIKKMADQCKLTTKDFYNLATCPLSAKDYLKKLQEKGGIIDTNAAE